jgi:hypothetical protein
MQSIRVPDLEAFTISLSRLLSKLFCDFEHERTDASTTVKISAVNNLDILLIK